MGSSGVWYRQRMEIRFCFLFAIFFAFLYWLLIADHGADASWTIEDRVTRSVVWVSGQVLALFGIAAQTEGMVLPFPPVCSSARESVPGLFGRTERSLSVREWTEI